MEHNNLGTNCSGEIDGRSLCLFEGDLGNRAFAAIGIGPKKIPHLIARMLILIVITWVPMAIMASFSFPLPLDATPAQNFFYDFAAYAQFFAGIPLFIIAERIMSENIAIAGRDFAESRVIDEKDQPRLKQIEQDVANLRSRLLPEIICIVIAFILAGMTIGPELFIRGPTTMHSWHVSRADPYHPVLTLAGAWEMFVALPIQIYWWVRWIWKIGLWTWYLKSVSKFKLNLAATHPDHTGGIGFLSYVQSRFAIVILAFGISNIVSTIGYKIAVEHAPIDLPPVWGPVVGFVIGAPLFFLAPLLLFTAQLYRLKKRALVLFREKAMVAAQKIEREWLYSPDDHTADVGAEGEISRFNLLAGMYDRIDGMRVVPFDLRSAAQLIGSAFGPIVPLLPYFAKIPTPWQKFLEAIMSWFPHH